MTDIEKPVDYDKEKEGTEVGATDEARKIRITLTSCNMKTLETVCFDLLKNARDKKVRTKGPIRIPTKTLRITTRKTPCGEGSKTWDHYQMRIHKRVIEVFTKPSIIKEVTKINIGPGVEVVVTLTG